MDNTSAFTTLLILPTTTFHRLIPLINSLPVVPRQRRLFPFLELPRFVEENRNLAQHIIHTLVKATVFENACPSRTQVSAIATHFLQTVFSTVHYMILPSQIPTKFSTAEKHEISSFLLLHHYCTISQIRSDSEV